MLHQCSVLFIITNTCSIVSTIHIRIVCIPPDLSISEISRYIPIENWLWDIISDLFTFFLATGDHHHQFADAYDMINRNMHI